MQRASLAVLVFAAVCLATTSLTLAQEESPPAEAGAEEAIAELLERQAAAWNRGDLEAFMEGYWKSPELLFTSWGRIRRGWETTYERFRERYGETPEAMGQLGFSEVEVHPLAADAAWALGHWRLERQSGVTSGIFTLVLRRIDGRWVIVHDHTSFEPQPSSEAQ